jgi:hypothetical protein
MGDALELSYFVSSAARNGDARPGRGKHVEAVG